MRVFPWSGRKRWLLLQRYCILLIVITLVGCAVTNRPSQRELVNEIAVEEAAAEKYQDASQVYASGDWKKSLKLYRHLLQKYPDSSFAVRAQLSIGSCLENLHKYSRAAEAYQKLVDGYPASPLVSQAIEAQYRIATLLFDESKKGKKRRFLPGLDLDQAIEIFQLVLKNAPYGEIAPDSHYQLAICYYRRGEFTSAIGELQTLINEFPDDELIEESLYYLALSHCEQASGVDFDQEETDQALTTFERLLERFPLTEFKEEIEEKTAVLRAKKAEKDYRTAEFYQKQGAKEAALIYYRLVVDNYPATEWGPRAREKIERIEKR